MPPTESLVRLITELGRLPGVGPKTAQRLAYHLLMVSRSQAEGLADAITRARERVRFCTVCGDWTEDDPCYVCSDAGRDRRMICVVEQPRDVAAIERTREYHGLYHVLHGALSPIDGIGPDALRLKELVGRVKKGIVEEVVVATNASLEGEATALYISGILPELGVRVTRLAYGIPVGGDLDYTDEVTLARALKGRSELKG